MARNKITVVGAGNVGGTVTQRLAETDEHDLVLVDIVDGLAAGKALDLKQAGAVAGYDTHIIGTTSYEASAGSSIAVITSGVPRKPGMSRDELLATNTKVVSTVVRELARHSPEAILILVTNPLDAMVHVAQRVSGFPPTRVMGMAGVLDSARLRAFIAMELGVSMADVQAMVLGGHGDSMVPLPRYTTVAGRPLTEWLPKERLEALVKRTRNGGAEIVNLLKAGSAFYAPAASVVDMVQSILGDQKRVLPCAVLCRGEYGLDNVVIGVPVKLGRGGVEAIIEYELSAEERGALAQSAAAVKELCEAVDKLVPR